MSHLCAKGNMNVSLKMHHKWIIHIRLFITIGYHASDAEAECVWMFG